MQNNDPKSELAAMKEKAGRDKDNATRQRSIDNEKKGREAGFAGKNNIKPSTR